LETTERPWGSYTVLHESPLTKVKEILVKEGNVLSYQSHSSRQEDWIILEGVGFVILDDIRREVKPGDHVRIPVHSKHRIGSEPGFGNLKFIEVQTGNYFGEDDIIRYEDIYGRS
tara:strand:+ start:279 stop:623 length:345 start_codon:yes stop_codon:yes gene_type:complete